MHHGKTPHAHPPGEILLEEFLKPLGILQNALARAIGVNPARISEIVHGRCGITAPTASALSLYFGTSPEMWMNLQSRHDLMLAERTVGKKLRKTVRSYKAAA
ncbi:MAG: HigA family addiction module antitoxin [Rhodospirillaceae bacterium]|nr:HigA family addiction module antitoxin [Rhodospirillaceae bacterium]